MNSKKAKTVLLHIFRMVGLLEEIIRFKETWMCANKISADSEPVRYLFKNYTRQKLPLNNYAIVTKLFKTLASRKGKTTSGP